MRAIHLLWLVSTATVAVAASSANIQEELEKAYLLHVKNTGTCIGATDTNSTALIIGGCTGDTGQLWTMPSRKQGQLVNMLTKTCLTMSNFKLPPNVDNKLALQNCSANGTPQQNFTHPEDSLSNNQKTTCVGVCQGDEQAVCSFEANDVEWCSNDTLINEKIGYVKYCSQTKAQGEWTVANYSECSAACGDGMVTYTWQCTPFSSDLKNSCCDLADMPPTEGSCNIIPCDAKAEDLYVLQTIDGRYAGVSEDDDKLVLSPLNGDMKQLWLPMLNTSWVNAFNQMCLTVPRYYVLGENFASTAMCAEKNFPDFSYQTFATDMANVPGPAVCLGYDDTSSAVAAVRDTDEVARAWCSAGSSEVPLMNRRMKFVPFCQKQGKELVCLGTAQNSPTPATATTQTDTAGVIGSTQADTAAVIGSTQADAASETVPTQAA